MQYIVFDLPTVVVTRVFIPVSKYLFQVVNSRIIIKLTIVTPSLIRESPSTIDRRSKEGYVRDGNDRDLTAARIAEEPSEYPKPDQGAGASCPDTKD